MVAQMGTSPDLAKLPARQNDRQPSPLTTEWRQVQMAAKISEEMLSIDDGTITTAVPVDKDQGD